MHRCGASRLPGWRGHADPLRCCPRHAPGPRRCQRCKPGYWLKAGKCYPCPARCATCKNSGGAAYCQSCKPGYKLQAGRCQITSCPSPYWDTNQWKWANVYGKTDAGSCVKASGAAVRACLPVCPAPPALARPQRTHAGVCEGLSQAPYSSC